MRRIHTVMRRVVALAVVMAVFGLACQEASDPPPSQQATLKEGDPAPNFALESPDREISLADYRGKKAVLLYFSMGPG